MTTGPFDFSDVGAVAEDYLALLRLRHRVIAKRIADLEESIAAYGNALASEESRQRYVEDNEFLLAYLDAAVAGKEE